MRVEMYSSARYLPVGDELGSVLSRQEKKMRHGRGRIAKDKRITKNCLQKKGEKWWQAGVIIASSDGE